MLGPHEIAQEVAASKLIVPGDPSNRQSVDDPYLDKLEDIIGFTLPNGYRDFVKLAGGMSHTKGIATGHPEAVIAAIRGASTNADVAIDLITTRRLVDFYPTDGMIFASDFFGSFFAIERDGSVTFWRRSNEPLITLAPDFDTFLSSLRPITSD